MSLPLRALLPFLFACGSTPPNEVEQNPTHPADHSSASTLEDDSATPPPIPGGTLLVTSDAFVVSDYERDVVHVVSRTTSAVNTIALLPHDEPGRLVADAHGRVHIALRRGGAVVTLDLQKLAVVERRDVCAAPRGLAYDATLDVIHVACATGELVTLPASGGPITRTLFLPRDLRDVVVTGDRVYVTRFRSAQLLVVDADGVVATQTPPTGTMATSVLFIPQVAWRSVQMPDGGVAILHQRETNTPLDTAPPAQTTSVNLGGSYGGSVQSTIVEQKACGALVEADVSILRDGAFSDLGRRLATTLAIDIAVSRADVAVASPTSNTTHPVVEVHSLLDMVALPNKGCAPSFPGFEPVDFALADQGQAIAIAFADDDTLVVQARQPAALFVFKKDVDLGEWDRLSKISLPSDADLRSAGEAMFYEVTPSSLACATCHPEGGDDGHVWQFVGFGPRRTQSIRGGVSQTAPLHWSGDMQSFSKLADDVFSTRMGGPKLAQAEVSTFERWVNNIPRLPRRKSLDGFAVARGKFLFESEDTKCSQCHSGPLFTNNESYNVGTGMTLQVPSLLGVGDRTPLMHDGCAQTIMDRLDATQPKCGGSAHGHYSQLTFAQKSDLATYLESL